jgi:hypothetical protein
MSMAAQWMEQTPSMVPSSCSMMTHEWPNFAFFMPQWIHDSSAENTGFVKISNTANIPAAENMILLFIQFFLFIG